MTKERRHEHRCDILRDLSDPLAAAAKQGMKGLEKDKGIDRVMNRLGVKDIFTLYDSRKIR